MELGFSMIGTTLVVSRGKDLKLNRISRAYEQE